MLHICRENSYIKFQSLTLISGFFIFWMLNKCLDLLIHIILQGPRKTGWHTTRHFRPIVAMHPTVFNLFIHFNPLFTDCPPVIWKPWRGPCFVLHDFDPWRCFQRPLCGTRSTRYFLFSFISKIDFNLLNVSICLQIFCWVCNWSGFGQV